MLRRSWQTAMIALARSKTIARLMQGQRATSLLADKYTGGGDVTAAVARAAALFERQGLRSSLFYLGEYIDDRDLIRLNFDQKLAIADALAPTSLDLHISVDPTQLGYGVDADLLRDHARRIAERLGQYAAGRSGVNCLMIDMEDHSVVDTTIALHDELAADGLPVGLTLQAYLRRTSDDVSRQIERGGRVRLVKGAFAASRDIAFTRRAEIKRHMRDIISLMLSERARERGFYPIIATHDDAIQDHAIREARRNGWAPGQYEFEMLLGVRRKLAEKRVGEGERVRLYVPFGKDWWPYGVRRIGENPANIILLGRSLFS